MNAWLVSTLILSLAWAWPAEAARYTLGQLVEKVTRESPSIVAARAAVAVRQAQVLEQQLRWLPDGEAGATLYGAPAVRYDVPGSTATTDIVDLTRSVPDKSPFDRAPIHAVRITLGADLRQPLYTFGKIAAAIGSARGGLAYDSGNLTRDELDVGLTAVRIYTQIRVARIALDSVEQTLQQMRDWEKQIDVALDGKNPLRFGETDLARIRLSIVNTEIAKLDYERNFVAAREALRQLANDPSADTDEADFAYTGSSQEAEVARDIARRPEVLASRAGLDYYGKWHHLHLSFALPDVGFVSSAWGGYVPNTEPLDTWQSCALTLRPEIRQMDASVASAESLRLLRRAELGPELLFSSSLNVGVATSMDTPQNYFLGRTNYVNATFGFLLRQPLDFGVRTARYKQAKYESLGVMARRRQSLSTYGTEIAKAWADYKEARGRAEKTGRGEKISRGWYNAINQDVSQSDRRELVDALQNYFAFRIRHFQAVYEANLGLAWLQRTTGVARQAANTR